MVVALGVGWILWWLGEFTPYVEWAGVTFGVAGMALAAIFGSAWWGVGEEKQEALRAWVAGWIASRRVRIVVGCAVLIFVCVTSGIGTVRLESPQGDFQGSVARADNAASRGYAVGKESNYPFWIWPWSSASIRVKVDQLPGKRIALRPWWRSLAPNRQQLPKSLLKPLVLVGAEQGIVSGSKSEEYLLAITVNEQRYEPTMYDGRTILIGTTDNDIPIPSNLGDLSGWKESLDNHRDSVLPYRTGVGPPSLSDGDQLAAEVTSKGDGRVLAACDLISLRQPVDRQFMVTPVLLKKVRQPFLKVILYEAKTSDIKRDKTSGAPIFEPGNRRRQGIPFYQESAVPITPRDWLRFEIDAVGRYYAYLIWIDTEGNPVPLYPWRKSDWSTLPQRQERRDRFSIPASEEGVIPMSPGKPGVETVILFLRKTPLTNGEQKQLERVCSQLPRGILQGDPNYWVVLVNGKEPIGEPTRGTPLTGDEAKVDHPKGRAVRFCKDLEHIFPYSRAVLLGSQGKNPSE